MGTTVLIGLIDTIAIDTIISIGIIWILRCISLIKRLMQSIFKTLRSRAAGFLLLVALIHAFGVAETLDPNRLDDLNDDSECSNSFAGSTLVLMSDGTGKRIDAIRVGDVVQSTDPESGKIGDRTVVAVFVHNDRWLTELKVRSRLGEESILNTTPNHLFWNQSTSQWTRASDLKLGDGLASVAGRESIVLGSATIAGSATRYNISVADLHTYYVIAGGSPALVHNDDLIPKVDSKILQNRMGALFHGIEATEKVGDGSALASANFEANGGKPVNGVNHIESTKQVRRSLVNFLETDVMRDKSGKKFRVERTARDIRVAKGLIKAIDDARGGEYSGLDDYDVYDSGDCS